MAKSLPIEQLKPGMVILQITRQDGPVKIRKSGLVTSQAMVEGLKEMGVMELEIDPDQTVELDNAPANQQSLSATQKLFASGSSPQQEQTVTDQFNRSLFMPSIQSLPAPWQYYGRRGAALALILAGGFAIGWLTATWPQWWPQHPEAPVEVVKTPSPQKQPEANADDPVTSTSDKHSAQVPESEADNSAKPKDKPSESQSVASQNRQPAKPEPRETIVPRAERQAQSQPDAISPELLRKFEQAVSAIDSDGQPAPQPEPSLPDDDEVVMVHELPAWALTELPSMSFSAHMYASNPEDRWVNVNGKELGEGDAINEDLRIVRIEPQRVVMAFRGQQFSMRALTDW